PPPPPVVQPEPQKPAAPPPPPARPPPSGEGPLRVAIEAGIWFTGRHLSYSGADNTGASIPLRTFSASAILVPRLRLEVYPAAFAGAGRLFSGIGLRLDAGQSVGLKVKPPSGTGGGNKAANLRTLEADLVWRLQPFSGSRFAFTPALGYRSVTLTTSGNIGGLPDAKLAGYELRMDLEAPLGSSFAILGGGGYTLWTSKKDMVSGDFFGSGSARGYELEGGLSYRVYGPISVRLLAEYQSTSYSGLKHPATGLGTASGASDTYFGGRIMGRAEF
ncbi:MAG TPA: hypothetical protein VFG59_03280, partial [Anaeromyxobacter sp.]|nr:hypothetical protein [Anaeromyxobacter sp.]